MGLRPLYFSISLSLFTHNQVSGYNHILAIMLSSTTGSILLLQSVAPLALGIALPGYPPIIPEDPVPPFRACAPFCRDPTYQLAEPDIYPNRNTWIVTIGRPGLYQSEKNPDINQVLATYLNESLPYFLDQIVSDNKTVPALVTAGSPLLVDAVIAIANETDVAPNAAKLKAWATSVDPKAPCDAFAASAVSILSVVGDTVYFANPREGSATTHEQDYFLQPAYGPISHRDDIIIHYNSKFPAFWGTTPTTNIDRNVYVRSNKTCAKYRAGEAAFEAQIKDLLTQFGQLKQWAVPDVDYIDTVYQIRYLKAYCVVNIATPFRLDFTQRAPQRNLLTPFPTFPPYLGRFHIQEQPIRRGKFGRLAQRRQTPHLRRHRQDLLHKLDQAQPFHQARPPQGPRLHPCHNDLLPDPDIYLEIRKG